MSLLQTIRAAIAVLLLGGVAGHAADAVLDAAEAAADRFAHSYDQDWNVKFPAGLKTMAKEVAEFTSCGEAACKKIEEGTAPIAAAAADFWRALYRIYYREHLDEYSQEGFWDSYPDMLSSEQCRKGIKEMTAAWESLLKSNLTGEQYALWQEQMKKRLERRVKAAPGWLKGKLDKLEKEIRSQYAQRLGTVVSTVGINPVRAERLKPAVDAAVKAHLDIRRENGERVLLLWNEDFRYCRTKSIEDMEKGKDNGYLAGIGKAGRAATKIFDEMVAGLLDEDERARLKKKDDEVKERLPKIAKTMAENLLSRYQQRDQPLLAARINTIASALGFDEERKKTFDDHLRVAYKIIEEEWKKRYTESALSQVQQSMRSADSETRLKQMENNQWWFSDEKADSAAVAARRKAWEEAVNTMLKPEEKTRWEVAEKAARERRIFLMARMAVAELDRRLFLQPDQRMSIEKLALETARSVGGFDGDLVELWQQNMGGALILTPGMKGGEAEALLDEEQRKEFKKIVERWRPNWTRLLSQLAGKS